jgi:glucuronosyltransferase
MKELSALITGEPQSALDRAVYWTEYVIKHKGASHLRPAAVDLPWYQYLLLDVLFVLITGALFVIFTVYLTLRTVYKLLTGKTTTKEKSG